ncbi:MAG: hypothetical protein KDC92_14575 [Bacteroidetes bacterium]|nr:hypothetical protein [Bacteroidota bacterium]
MQKGMNNLLLPTCLLLLCTCSVFNKDNGFTVRNKYGYNGVVEHIDLKFVSNYETSGTFARIYHKKSTYLDVFISNNATFKELRTVVDNAANSNDPSEWEFFYAPFTPMSIDTLECGKKIAMHPTMRSFRELFSKNDIMTHKYKSYYIEYAYVKKIKTTKVTGKLNEINSYNSQKFFSHPEKPLERYTFKNSTLDIVFLIPDFLCE